MTTSTHPHPSPTAGLPHQGLPLTPGQSALWFAQCAEPGSTSLQCAELLTFDHGLDPELLSDVITRCLAGLPTFRAEFRTAVDGHPVLLPAAGPAAVRISELDDAADLPAWINQQVQVPAMTTPGVLTSAELSGHHLAVLPDGTWVWLARFHHILGDGFAFHALIRWIADCYSAALEDRSTPASPFLSPTDALARSTAYPASEQYHRDREFWVGQPVTADPVGLAPATGAVGGTISATAEIPGETRTRLRALARDCGVGDMDLLTAVVAHYTAALSDQETVTLGLPQLNRPMGLPGFALDPLVNLLPLTVDMPPENSLGEDASRIAGQLRELRGHGGFRTEYLRRELGITDPARRLTGPSVNIRPFSPVFHFGPSTATLTTVAVGPINDVEIIVQPAPGDGLELLLLAHGESADRPTLEGHAHRLAQLLGRVATELSGAAGRLGDLDLLTPAEHELLVHEFNATDRPLDLPAEATLSSVLAAQRDRDLSTPGRARADGLLFGADRLSRRELWEQVDALARHLTGLGIGPGDIVAVQLRRSPALVIALAAVSRAGAAWLPISPELPRVRRKSMWEIADPVALITGAGQATELLGQTPVVELNELSLHPVTGSADETTPDPPAPTPEDLAYVLFTSGSTGTPKAVAVPQGAIINRLWWMAAYYDIGPADTILQKTPCSFDVSVWEFLLPFTHGVRLAVAAEGAHRDPAELTRELARHDVSICHFVPAALKAFLAGSDTPPRLPHLRAVITSGEALDSGVAEQCTRLLGVALHNLYGPTEAAVDVTAHTFVPGEKNIPIGAPVWNTRTYVLDANLRPVPVGTPGRLFLAGVQLARGYLGRPDLTRQRFIPDPFFPGQLMYDSGDIAQWRADGELLFHGRKDSQIKLRGQRIELGEIETVLARHPAVSQCAVVGRDVAGETTIVAYLVPTAGTTGDNSFVEVLRAHAAAVLPEYMIPAFLVPLTELPVTANGKLDQRNLPEPVLSEDPDTVVPPAGPWEEGIHRAFAGALNRPMLSVMSNFFEAGGNSLSAVMLARALQTATGATVTIADVFAAPTIRGMAARLAARSDSDAGLDRQAYTRLLELRPHTRGTPVFCFHPAGGLGWAYSGLLPHLDHRRGVQAVQSPGILETGLRAASLQEAACLAAADIITAAYALAEPAGEPPAVDLLGWSVGGVIAQATAPLIADAGITVRTLCLLDSYPAELWRGRPAPDEQDRLQGLLNMTGATIPPGQQLDQRSVLAAIRDSRSPFAALPDEVMTEITELIGHNARLMREHTTHPWPGTVHFFKAGLNPEPMDEQSWLPHVSSLQVRELAVTHPGLVSSASLREVARVLDR